MFWNSYVPSTLGILVANVGGIEELEAWNSVVGDKKNASLYRSLDADATTHSDTMFRLKPNENTRKNGMFTTLEFNEQGGEV